MSKPYDTNTLSHACAVLSQIIRETPEVSGLMNGVQVFVLNESDEQFDEKLEHVIRENLGVAIAVRTDGWQNYLSLFPDGSMTVDARFTVRISANVLLNSTFAVSLNEMAIAIIKAVSGSCGDDRFLSPFVAGSMSVFAEGNSRISRELTFEATLRL